jgi:Putative Ig domain
MPNTTITVPLTSIGGTAPYTYSVLAGPSTTFPGTITVNNTLSTLFLDSTSVNSGTYTIKLQVADSLGSLFDSIISVIVEDPTIFNILNDNQSFAPSSFPVSFSIPLLSSGGNGTIQWSIISSVTTLPNPTIDGLNNLKFTLTNFGSFTVGLNATDAVGNSVSAVIIYSINSSTVYALVDGQIEALVTAPIDNLGTHHFTATVKDAANTTFQGTTFYQALTPVSGIHIPEAYFDHYWGPGDTLSIVFPVQGNFSGFALGPATITQPTNGLAVTLDNVNKVAKVQGPPTLFQNSQVRIPLPILQGTTQVAVVSREYTLLSDNVTNNGANFTFTAFTRPYIVGDFVGLNALKPYFNSPNIAKNSAYTVRVQTASALPLGVSLDANTGLMYGTLVGTTPTSSILEYVDAQNIVHGTVTVNWTLFTSQFTLVDNLVPAQIQVPYPIATATTNCISSNSPSALTTVSLVAGVLPAGLTISVDNTINSPIGVVKITGTPTEAGYFDCWFAVTNTNGQVAYLYKRFTSNFISPLVILTQTIPALVTSSAYSFSLQGFGGVPPYTWSSPQWPGGHNPTFPGTLAFSSAGVFSGSTTALNGTSQNDTFILTDATGTTTNAVLNVNVNDTLRITTTVLPIIVPGQPYSFSMSALGGTPPYTWASVPGVPPPTGITFNSSGVFSGVTSGTISTTLSITVTDSVFATANHNFSFATGTASGLQIDTSGVGQVNRGVAYQGLLRVFGPGTAPFSWQIPPSSPNTLPTGLSILANTNNQGVTANIQGVYSGSPFTNLPVEIEVTDNNGNSAFAYILLSSGTDLVITTPSLPSGVITGTYSPPTGFQIQASGGVPPYTFSLDGSSPVLPPGFSLSSSGVLSGTTGAAYNQNIVIDVHDSMSPSNNAPPKTLNLLIQASTLNITNSSPLPSVTSGLPYSVTLVASGGTGPYSFSLSPISGAVLPAGLSLASNGTISGTTTTTNTSVTPTFRVTDSIGAFFDKALTLNLVTGLALKTGIDFVDGTSTNSLGFITNGNVNSINPNPNNSFYVYCSGVLSTQPSQLMVQLGGLAGATATVLSINTVTQIATIQLNGPFQNGAVGNNNLTVTVTDQGVTISKTFTWTVYINPALRLAPGTGSFPTLSPTFGGSNQPYMPVLENTSGHIYIYNDPSANTFTLQSYNAVQPPKAQIISSGDIGLTANNTEWQGRLGFVYDPTALSGAGAFEFTYNGAAIDANVPNTNITIFDKDIAWFNTTFGFDLYTISGSTGGQTIPMPVYYLLDPFAANSVTVAPTTLSGNGQQQTITINMIKPLPPLQSDTIASIIWGGTVLTTNSIVPVYSNGIPGAVTSYNATLIQSMIFHTNAGGAASVTGHFSANVTVGNTIILGFHQFDYTGGVNPTLFDNLGNVYHLCGAMGTNGFHSNAIYYAHITNGGSCTITISGLGTQVSGNPANQSIQVVAAEFNGLLSPESIDGYASFNPGGYPNSNQSNNANTGTIFPSNAHDVIFSNIGDCSGAPPAGFTLIGTSLTTPSSFYGGASLTNSLAYRVVSAVGTYAAIWSSAGNSGNTVAFKLNPIVTLVPNNSGIVGYTVQVTPPIIHNVNSTMNLTLHGIITYLSGDSFTTGDVVYMNNVTVATIHLT